MALINACSMTMLDFNSKIVWAMDNAVAMLKQVLDLWVQLFHVLHI